MVKWLPQRVLQDEMLGTTETGAGEAVEVYPQASEEVP